MKDIITLVILITVVIILIKLLLKITSFLVKLIIWLLVIFVGIYFLNYFVLPKIGSKPLPIKEWMNKVIKEKKVKEKIKVELKQKIEKQVVPATKKVLQEKDKIITETLKKITTGYITK